MSQVSLRALAVVAVLVAGPDVIAQQTPAPVPHVTVTGEVNHPGSIDWTPQMTVQAAIDATGGLTDRATRIFTITRAAGTRMISLSSPQPSHLLEPGDRLDVARRPYAGAGPRVFVAGAVRSPGAYTVTAGSQSISAAIAAAGGFTADAGKEIQVWTRPGPLRQDAAPIDASTKPDEVVIYHVSRKALDSRDPFVGVGDNGAVVVPRADAVTFVGGSVTMTGDVRKPGIVRADRLSVRAALVAAGGLSSEQGRSISIAHAHADGSTSAGGRETVGYREIADGSLDVPLRDGDVVRIAHFVAGGSFSTAGSKMRVVQWTAGTSLNGANVTTTAQEALTKRNSEPMMGDGPPWAPMVLADMTVERQGGDRLEVLRPTPTFVLVPGDAVTVIQRRWDVPTYPLKLDDLVGDWAIDSSRDLRLQIQGGTIKGVMTEGATSTRLAGEAFGNLVVLRAAAEPPRAPLAPGYPLSSICTAYFGPGGQLVGRTQTLHVGVDGLHYTTDESWHAVYR
jgi:protein involved in polysaccharide export with SLBB domain